MTKQTSPAASDPAAQAGSARHGFGTPVGLRALLIRLHEAGPDSWRGDREAAELMRYTAQRYRRLAREYGLDPWEVASEAFEVMLSASARNARNPWAVVTRAVQITCIAEIRAAGLLVATSKVRHTARIAGFHDALRFADREGLADYHPAFAVNPTTDGHPREVVGRAAADRAGAPRSETRGHSDRRRRAAAPPQRRVSRCAARRYLTDTGDLCCPPRQTRRLAEKPDVGVWERWRTYLSTCAN